MAKAIPISLVPRGFTLVIPRSPSGLFCGAVGGLPLISVLSPRGRAIANSHFITNSQHYAQNNSSNILPLALLFLTLFLLPTSSASLLSFIFFSPKETESHFTNQEDGRTYKFLHFIDGKQRWNQGIRFNIDRLPF